MAEDHKFIEGPKRANGTGMIYYLEQYDCDQNDGAYEKDKHNDSGNSSSSSEFKGYSIMLTPLASQSFIDVLPQFKENHNNFMSYIDKELILTRHSGRFFVFHNTGQFLGQVKFEKMANNFR